jgi:tetratricopeptide (TPR) repeat protein
MGNFDDAVRIGREALSLDEVLTKPANELLVTLWLAWCHGLRGEFSAALEFSARAVMLAEQHGSTAMLIPGLSQHGYNLCGLGRGMEGVPFIERGIALGETHRVLYFQSLWLVQLAQAHLWNHESSKAETVALRGMAVAREREEPPHEAWACYVAGEVALRNGNLTTTEAYYRDALALSEARGMRPLVAHCHLGLGKLYRSNGQREQAREHLVTATTMYREMGMTYWLEQAGAEMNECT